MREIILLFIDRNLILTEDIELSSCMKLMECKRESKKQAGSEIRGNWWFQWAAINRGSLFLWDRQLQLLPIFLIYLSCSKFTWHWPTWFFSHHAPYPTIGHPGPLKKNKRTPISLKEEIVWFSRKEIVSENSKMNINFFSLSEQYKLYLTANTPSSIDIAKLKDTWQNTFICIELW